MAFLFEVSGVRLEVREDNDIFTAMGIPAFLPSAMVDEPSKHGVTADGAVFVTSAFMRLPKYFRDIALTHEAGHVSLGHLSMITDDQRGEVIVDDQIEAEADRFAADIVGESAYDFMLDAVAYESLKAIREAGGNVTAAKPILDAEIEKRKTNYKTIQGK